MKNTKDRIKEIKKQLKYIQKRDKDSGTFDSFKYYNDYVIELGAE